MRPTPRQSAAIGSTRAFTLVEMLVVMFIIVTLVMLLMPTVNAARNMAKETSTRALIHTLENGLALFKSETRLGRQYPPSYWPAHKGSPYSGSMSSAYGAQTLVWALAGPELRGTAGFMTDNIGDLYASDPPPTLYGPFIDISKARIEKPTALNLDPMTTEAPVFMDDFGGAVLYFKARIGASPTEIYDIGDNYAFLEKDAAGQAHPLLWNEPGNWWTETSTDPPSGGSGFLGYIEDLRVAKMSSGARHAPHNPDSFLLISAGRDQLYGTADDIANFPFNPVD